MFFNVDQIKEDIEKLYQTLVGKGKISKKWWSWEETKEKLLELSEEDDNLIEDILALYEQAKMVGKEDLLREIEAKALKLRKHLEKMKEGIELGDFSLRSGHQKRLLNKIIHKLKEEVKTEEVEEQTEKKGREKELDRFIKENTSKHFFTFYRAEHIAEKPRLNEDSSGQFGKGVYFTASMCSRS